MLKRKPLFHKMSVLKSESLYLVLLLSAFFETFTQILYQIYFVSSAIVMTSFLFLFFIKCISLQKLTRTYLMWEGSDVSGVTQMAFLFFA